MVLSAYQPLRRLSRQRLKPIGRQVGIPWEGDTHHLFVYTKTNFKFFDC